MKNFEYPVAGSWARDRLQDFLPFLSPMSSFVSYACYQALAIMRVPGGREKEKRASSLAPAPTVLPVM